MPSLYEMNLAQVARRVRREPFDPDRLYSRAEAAAWLGLSPAQLKRRVDHGTGPLVTEVEVKEIRQMFRGVDLQQWGGDVP